jgi:hypothetical protein
MDSFDQMPHKPIDTEYQRTARRLMPYFDPMRPSELAKFIYSEEARLAAKTTTWEKLDAMERSVRTRVADAVLKELYRQLDEQQS